jgi:hypothetical protein
MQVTSIDFVKISEDICTFVKVLLVLRITLYKSLKSKRKLTYEPVEARFMLENPKNL